MLSKITIDFEHWRVIQHEREIISIPDKQRKEEAIEKIKRTRKSLDFNKHSHHKKFSKYAELIKRELDIIDTKETSDEDDKATSHP